MKQIQTKTLLAMAAIAVLLLSGCTKEPQTKDEGDGTYLSLSIDGVKAATSAQSTRATTVNESAVNDLWVLQFQMTAGSTTVGTLVKKTYIATVADLTKIKYIPVAGSDMMVYLVANSGSSSLFSSTADGATLAAVKATTVSVTATDGKNFPAAASTNLPMVGQSANLTFHTPTAVAVTLTRTAAKIALTVKNLLAEGYPQLTVSSVQLKNGPKTYSMQVVNRANGFTGTTYYPAASAANFANYTAVSGNITAAGTTSTYYLAPNIRGISTNTSYRLKSDLTAVSGQGSFCTYVEILGTAKASVTAPAVDVRYRLYLGGNNTSNFNLESNTAYKVDINLTGINGNDARMTITTDKFDLSQGGTDGDHEDDIIGWIPPAVGDYYFTDGSFSSKVESGKTVNGLVYYVDVANPTKFKVMALDEGPTLKWAANNNYTIGSGAHSLTDGRGNVAAIKAAFDSKMAGIAITESTFNAAFPAAAYCYNYRGKDGGDLEGTWYLPSKNDLQYLYCAFNGAAPVTWDSGSTGAPAEVSGARTKWDGLLTSAGGTGVTASGTFWSSTENSGNTSNTSNVWCVYFSYGYTTNYVKSSNGFYVRCVRNIPSPPAVGDYYFTDGSFSSKMESGKTVNGVIYYVDAANPTKFKVMALDEGPTLKWAANDNYVIGSGAQSFTDGRGNAAAIKAAFDSKTAGVAITESTFNDAFPVAAYCYNYRGKGGSDLEGTWYLPSKNDLQYLYCAFNGAAPVTWDSGSTGAPAEVSGARTKWDGLLTSAGGTGVTASGTFWSSTENSGNTSISWYVNLGNGSTIYSSKTYTSRVRCVRDL